MIELKKYLNINGSFSALSGISMILCTCQLNDLFGFDHPYIFPIIGINLLIFAGFVFVTSLKFISNKKLVQAITVMDVLWVLGSLAILIFDLFSLTIIGRLLIGLVAVWIAFLAFKQIKHSK